MRADGINAVYIPFRVPADDLQEFIANSPEAFFGELGQELLLLGKEVQPSTTVQDRIDLLGIDKEGTCVVIEIKRGNHKLQMLQAISYAVDGPSWFEGGG